MRTKTKGTIILLLCLALILGLKSYSHQQEAGTVTEPSVAIDPSVASWYVSSSGGTNLTTAKFNLMVNKHEK